MSKLTPTEASRIIPVSLPTLYRDMKKGKVSFETNGKDKRLIDVSELQRVYGELKIPSDETNETQISNDNQNDTSQNISLTNNDNQNCFAQNNSSSQFYFFYPFNAPIVFLLM